MANKLSDILLMIQNTQIRIALEKLAGLAGISMDSTDSSAIVSDVIGDVTGNVTGDVTGSATKLNVGSAPTNGVAAVGTLTLTGVGVDNEIFTVGADIYEILTGTTLVNGTIAVDCTASHAAADVITNLVAAQVASGTEPFTFSDGAGDTLVVTADAAGPSTTVFTTDFTNGSVDGTGTLADATTVGVLGTVAEIGTIFFDAAYLYIAKAAATATTVGAWRRIALGNVF
jgi:hypothetical protein